MRNLFLRLTYPKLYFKDQIFAIWGQNYKNNFAIIPQQFMITKIFALKVSKQAICKFA